ncbi:MAG TPA: LLM class flavin-dependent oxidoreductase [Pseudonocardiaceae bacterium]
MSDRPFRFGITTVNAANVGTVAEQAREAEDLGFDTLLAPDPMGTQDPLTTLAAVAAVTTRLHFGTFVLAVSYRDKGMLNWQANTLNTLSGGRFELGLGIGRPGGEHHAARLHRDYGTPGQRIAWLADTIAEIKRTPDHPKLMLAGAGPKLLDLAARDADIVTLTWAPTTTPAEADVVVDRFRRAAGDRVDEIELNLNLISVGDKPATALEKYIGVSTAELAKMGAISVLPGDADENAATLLGLRDRWGVSYISVNGDYMHQFAPIIERLR